MATFKDDETQLRELVASWMAATKRGDVQAVLALMTDDVVFLVPGQPPMNKAGFKAAMSAMSASEAGVPRIEGVSEIKDIQIMGELAYMWTQLKLSIAPAGTDKIITRAGHTLSVLRKEQGCGRLRAMRTCS